MLKRGINKIKKRRVLWIVILILLIFFLVWTYWGNTSIQITEISINSEKIPESFSGFSIVHVSDLHNTAFGVNQSQLLNIIQNIGPDLIAVTGDLIDSRHTDIETAMAFIRGAIEIAPVYYVTGNHESRIAEYTDLQQQMEQAGVVILNDECFDIANKNESIQVLGVNDPDFTPYDDAYFMDTRLKDMRIKDNTYTVLLSHRPELFDVYAENHIDLVLSGHAHGGQVRIPFIGGLIAPDQGLFPQYSEGVYEKGQTQMVVSRGLGNSLFPMRINNRPELVVITLG